jgi:peptidoglycan hydrolase CwlO-like protein
VSVLNKTFNDINESIAKINELETKIKSLENIIIEHNELLKKIVNIISK